MSDFAFEYGWVHIPESKRNCPYENYITLADLKVTVKDQVVTKNYNPIDDNESDFALVSLYPIALDLMNWMIDGFSDKSSGYASGYKDFISFYTERDDIYSITLSKEITLCWEKEKEDYSDLKFLNTGKTTVEREDLKNFILSFSESVALKTKEHNLIKNELQKYIKYWKTHMEQKTTYSELKMKLQYGDNIFSSTTTDHAFDRAFVGNPVNMNDGQ